jgi:hypothetical protein
MKAFFKTWLPAVCAGLLMQGVAQAEDPAGETVAADRATAIAQEVLNARMDLSTVRVVRMTAGDAQLEVVSLRPTLYHMSGDAPEAAGTLIAFTKDKGGVVFLTREKAGGPARHHELAWSEIAKGNTFRFPVMTADGETQTLEIRIDAKFQKPESTD